MEPETQTVGNGGNGSGGVVKTVLWLVVLVLVVGGFILYGSKKDGGEEAAPKEPIKIGFIGSLTGDAAEYGEPQRNALQLAVEDINKTGGIVGSPVAIIYEDGKCNGKDGASAAQKLINVDKVKVILGGSCSSETLAAVPIAEAAKVFIFTGSASSPDLIGKSKFFARDYPNDLTQGKVLAEAANAKGWKKVAVIQEQTDYASGIVKAFTTKFVELGGGVMKEEFTTDTNDFRSPLTKLKASNSDALLISTQTTSSGERILVQMQELKWKPALMVNDVIGTNKETVEKNKTILEEALLADFLLDPSNSKLSSLDAAYKERYGKEMGYPNYTSAVYDSLYIIRDGIAAVGLDGEKLADWVRTVKDWQGASGSITISVNGERDSGHVLKVIKDGKVEAVK